MRPLSVGELLDASFSAVRRNFRTLVLCTLVIAVPLSILDTLITASATDGAFDFTNAGTISQDDVGPQVAGGLVSRLLSLAGEALSTAACLRALGGAVVGAPATPGESLRYAARRLGPLLWVTLLYTLALIAGVFMCGIGLIWLGVMFSLATPVLLFEETRGTTAMSRSRELIADHWWRTFGALLVGYLLVFVVQFALGALLGGVLLANSDSEAINAVLYALATIIGFAVALPILSALKTYIYFDLRVRKEGFDLQLLAAQIQTPAPHVEGLPPSDAGATGTGFLPPQPPPGA